MDIRIYDRDEVNSIERYIEKTKLLLRFIVSMDVVENNPYMDTFRLVVELLEKVQYEGILHRTIEALAHYYDVHPDWRKDISKESIWIIVYKNSIKLLEMDMNKSDFAEVTGM